MTELYTHFDPSQFGEVPKVQEALLAKPEEKAKARAAGVLIFPAQENIQKWKRA